MLSDHLSSTVSGHAEPCRPHQPAPGIRALAPTVPEPEQKPQLTFPDGPGMAPAPRLVAKDASDPGGGWGSCVEGSLSAPASKGHSMATRQAGRGL